MAKIFQSPIYFIMQKKSEMEIDIIVWLLNDQRKILKT